MARKRPNHESKNASSITELQALLGWIRPICLFLLGSVICWSLIQPLDSTSVFDGSALPQNLAFFLLAVGVSFDLVLSHRRNQLSSFEVYSLIGLSVWMLIVTLNAASLCNPRTGWNGFWHVVSLFSLYFATRNLIDGTKLRTATMLILLGGSAVLASVALAQVTIAFPRDRAEYRANPEEVIAKLGLDAPAGSPLRQRLENRLNSPEPYATFALANSLAVLLSGSLVLAIGALGFGIMRKSVDEKANPLKLSGKSSVLIAVIWFALISLVWLLTRSRTAFLSVPVALTLFAIGAYWQFGSGLFAGLTSAARLWMKRLVIGLGCCVIFGMALLAWKDPRVFTEATKSLSFRFDYWEATLSIIKDHPLLGVGLGNFQTFYPKYMLVRASETIADPHNWVLDLASTCSVSFAFVVVVGLALHLLRKPVDSLQEDATDNTKFPKPLVLGATVGGLAVLLGMMLFGLDELTAITVLITGIVACVACYWIGPTFERFMAQTTLGPVCMAVAMLLCLLVSGSWQATGLAVPLICCLACSRASVAGQMPSLAANRKTTVLMLVCSTLALVGFLWQSWSPVLKSSAEANGLAIDGPQRLKRFESARKIDPADSQWDRGRAQLLVEQALEARDLASFEAAAKSARQAIDDWAIREPNSFLTGQFCGDRLLDLSEKAKGVGSEPNEMRQRAVKYYEAAVKNRPTSAQLRVQLAYGNFLVGNLAAANTEIAEGLKISEATPHEDQKLSSQLVWVPGAPVELSGERAQRPYGQAELVVAWIRTHLNP